MRRQCLIDWKVLTTVFGVVAGLAGGPGCASQRGDGPSEVGAADARSLGEQCDGGDAAACNAIAIELMQSRADDPAVLEEIAEEVAARSAQACDFGDAKSCVRTAMVRVTRLAAASDSEAVVTPLERACALGAQHACGPSSEVLTRHLDRKNVVQQTIQANNDALQRCYNGALSRDESQRGRMMVAFTIASNGTVASATVTDHDVSLSDATLHGCVLQIFSRMVFWLQPRGVEGETEVQVTYPVKFERPPGARPG